MQGVFAYIGTVGGRKMAGACSGGYTFGFNGQAKDDEVYGEGNAYAFEYRIHDARIGRFLSVDPLYRDYPWNSTYAFAENSTIAFIDLEGAERYYAADGKLLGKIGTSNEIRIINNEGLIRGFNNVKTTDNGAAWLYKLSLKFSDADESAQKNVALCIFRTNVNPNIKNDQIIIGNHNTIQYDGEAAHTVDRQYVLFPFADGVVLDDYYTMVNLFIHEYQHFLKHIELGYIKGAEYGNDPWNHYEVFKIQVEHSSFKYMNEDGVKYVKSVGKAYLDHQFMYLNEVFGAKGSISASLKDKDFKRSYNTYNRNVEFFNKKFNESRKKFMEGHE